jgi:hypothetical protein
VSFKNIAGNSIVPPGGLTTGVGAGAGISTGATSIVAALLGWLL